MKKTDEKVEKSRHIKKEAMLEALTKSLGIATTACNKVDVPQSTFYKWKKTDPEFAERVKAIDNIALDLSESKMLELINGGSEALVKFHLSHKGKDRGYVQRKEITGLDGEPNNFIIEIIDSADKNTD